MRGPEEKRYVFLTGLHADMIARHLVLASMGGAVAYLGCPMCKLVGTRCGHTTRFLGYSSPAVSDRSIEPGVVTGKQWQMGVNDGDRMYSHSEWHQRLHWVGAHDDSAQ